MPRPKNPVSMPCICGPCSLWVYGQIREPGLKYPRRELVFETLAADFILTQPKPGEFLVRWSQGDRPKLPRGRRPLGRLAHLVLDPNSTPHQVKAAALRAIAQVLELSQAAIPAPTS